MHRFVDVARGIRVERLFVDFGLFETVSRAFHFIVQKSYALPPSQRTRLRTPNTTLLALYGTVYGTVTARSEDTHLTAVH